MASAAQMARREWRPGERPGGRNPLRSTSGAGDGLQRPKAPEKSLRRPAFDVQLDRHESKYLIPASLVPEIREFIRPFCKPDAYATGDPPVYTVTTMQLDGPGLQLHHLKDTDAINRFKLRVRTYGEPGSSPIFMEVKRKLNQTVVKSRSVIPFEAWGRDLIYNPRLSLKFRSVKEELAFLDFVRLARQIGAAPVCLVRYLRESYFSVHDTYARVSMDRKLEYLLTTRWNDWGTGARWKPFDATGLDPSGRSFSGIILELKMLRDAPQWMVDLVAHFRLARRGICKYSAAIWREALFRGTPGLPLFAEDALIF